MRPTAPDLLAVAAAVILLASTLHVGLAAATEWCLGEPPAPDVGATEPVDPHSPGVDVDEGPMGFVPVAIAPVPDEEVTS